jgi:hypothetical protein
MVSAEDWLLSSEEEDKSDDSLGDDVDIEPFDALAPLAGTGKDLLGIKRADGPAIRVTTSR